MQRQSWGGPWQPGTGRCRGWSPGYKGRMTISKEIHQVSKVHHTSQLGCGPMDRVRATILDVNCPLLDPYIPSSTMFPALPKSSHLLLLLHSNHQSSGEKLNTHTSQSLRAHGTLEMVGSTAGFSNGRRGDLSRLAGRLRPSHHTAPLRAPNCQRLTVHRCLGGDTKYHQEPQ